MGTIVILLAGAAGGMVLGVVGFAWLSQRTRTSANPQSLPADAPYVVELLRRVHAAAAACVVIPGIDPVWAKAAPSPPDSLLERTSTIALLALGDGEEHIVKEQGLIVAVGDGRLGSAVLFASTDVPAEAIQDALRDLRRLVADYQLARAREPGGLERRRNIPDWLTPESVEGIAAGVCEAARTLTGHPTAVVARDPIIAEASVIAVSAGADRRLVRTPVPATSVAGRACAGDPVAAGSGGRLFGTLEPGRRRKEEQGVVYSLRDGTQGVGALVVFAEGRDFGPRVEDELNRLAHQAGPLMGRASALYAAKHRAMIDELTGQPNRLALETAIREQASRQCSLLSVVIDGFDQLDGPAARAALKHVARVFRQSLREYDVPARVNGNAFALFLPDTPFHHAFAVADRIRIAVSESVFDWAGAEHLLTCSFGVASVPESARNTATLLAAANMALHDARAKGSNRVSAGQSLAN